MNRVYYNLTGKASREYKAARRRQRQEYLDKLKSQPCADCGISYPPYVMDFDHVRAPKVASVSKMVMWGWEKLKTEIAKCEIVCANCHRERSYQRSLNGEAVG